jgi:hypothetical protein
VSPTTHLDDDRLSALLDGEATADDVQHADGCPECRTRVDAWRAVTGKVAAQPGPVAAQRHAAVEAALAATEPAVTSSPGGTIPFAGHRRRPAAFSWPRVAAAVAAVVVLAGIGVSVSRLEGGGPGAASTAAGGTHPPAGSPAARAESPSQGSASLVPTAGVALGSYQDPDGVVAALRDLLGSPSAAPSAPAGSASGSAPGSSAGSAPGSVPGSTSGSASGPPPAATAGTSQCLTEAATGAKVAPQSLPVLDATLTYRGSPARAYVFAVAGRHTVAVVGEPGCGLLTVASF